jgi:glycosyltransferase involved in cell wall biosynthesis
MHRSVVIANAASSRTEGSVPRIGFEVAKGISERTDATMIFHATDRELVAGALSPEHVRFAGSRHLARTLRRISLRLFPQRWNLISMIEFVDYAIFDMHAYLIARRLLRRARVDYVLRVNPVSLRFPSVIPRLPTAVFTGPHNGGIEWAPGFSFLEASDRSGHRFRFLGDILHRVYGDIRRYAGIFVANDMCARSVPRRHRDKVMLLPENGVDRVRPSAAHAGDATRLLFVGRLNPFKGADFIIRALARLPVRVELTVVGDGPQRGELEELAQTLGVSRRCHFLGLRPHADLGSIYAEAGVFVFPSVRESGGAVVLEAMSYGLPCIVADWGGPATYTKSSGVQLPVDSPEVLENALVRTIETFLENPEEARCLGEKGKDVIRGEYVWGSKAEQLHTAMLERLSGRSDRPDAAASVCRFPA